MDRVIYVVDLYFPASRVVLCFKNLILDRNTAVYYVRISTCTSNFVARVT